MRYILPTRYAPSVYVEGNDTSNVSHHRRNVAPSRISRMQETWQGMESRIKFQEELTSRLRIHQSSNFYLLYHNYSRKDVLQALKRLSDTRVYFIKLSHKFVSDFTFTI